MVLIEFDKRTALGASPTFSQYTANSTLTSDDFSKALAGQVATEVVSVVPQLDDYLCPICFTIAYRPVRLRCGHLFCIRCMVLLQRDRKDLCALCREPSVLEADSENLDRKLMHYLEKYFPDDVKAKQKAIGKAMAMEQFGGHKCVVM
jgi:E3 ubiquitin-protein ligase BAH